MPQTPGALRAFPVFKWETHTFLPLHDAALLFVMLQPSWIFLKTLLWFHHREAQYNQNVCGQSFI